MNTHCFKSKSFMPFRCLLVLLILMQMMLPPLSPCPARAEGTEQTRPARPGGAGGAAAVIEKFNATLLEAMQRAKELGYEGRYKLLEPVIRDSFALEYMGSVVLGRYWKTLSDKQRKLFMDTYTQWTIATYAGRFDGYAGEQFQIASESKPEKGVVTVVSRMTQSKGEKIDFHYLLRTIQGNWRIADIKIAGVSQLALTRAQFVSVIKVKGFDALISMLREKTRHFERGGE